MGNDDLRRALELIHRVQSAPDLDEYRARVLDICGLVDGHIVGYNEVDAAIGETFALLDPFEALFDGVHERFARHAHEHPVIRHATETGDPRPRAISDFLSGTSFTHSASTARSTPRSGSRTRSRCCSRPRRGS